MSWEKLGCVFSCQQNSSWQHSHAYVPTALVMPDRIRAYTAFRDAENIGRIGYVDLDLHNPMLVLGISPQPVVDIGMLGAFDDRGVTPLSIVREGDEVRLYYAGWHLSQTVRYHLFIGLAVSLDGGKTFKRHGHVPVLDRTEQAWLVRSGASIIKDGDIWKCWCATGTGSVDIGGKMIPTYDWSYLESDDGIQWPQIHRVALRAVAEEGILGYGRSHVLKENGIYKAWVSVRSVDGGYRSIAYTHSGDGVAWSPFDYENGMLPSGVGFDSESVCFPSIFDVGTKRYMLYNGNDFGGTGFGLAIWKA